MSISALSKKCVELFNRCFVSVASDGEDLAVIENHLFRFNLWVQNNAAISEKRDSMDWRLRKASVPHSVIQNLLEDLAESIKRSFPSVESPHQSGLSGDTLDEIGGIDGILDELFRFSRAIRRSGAMRRFVKVANYFEYDEETGENLTVKFQDTVLPYLNATLKQTSKGLRERLHETICLRQQNFSFLKSRSGRKLVLRLAKEPELESTPSVPQSSSRLGSSYSIRSRQTTKKASQPGRMRRSTPRTLRSATTVNTNKLPLVEPIPEQKTVEYTGVDLPRRPKVAPGKNELECPYCFLVYPAKEFTKENWPRHIVQDLMPYICVLEPCQTPNALFDSHGAWISHMEKEHAREGWACMDSGHSATQYFEDEQLFRRHILERHDHDITADELDDIVDEFFGPLPAFQVLESCPFCEHYDPEDDSTDIDQHIAMHLVFLSQVSLPGDFLETKDAEFESDFEKSSSRDRLEGSQRSLEFFPQSTVSSFRTVGTGSSRSSVNNPRLLATVEDAIRRLILPELNQLKEEQRKKKDADEPSDDDASLKTPPTTSPTPDPPVTSGAKLSDVIREPPPITLRPGEPDIWDELQVRQALERQKKAESSYDPETDINLWSFRLFYIQHLQDYNEPTAGGEGVIESSMQLAGALDTRGRYSDAEMILKKMISDMEIHENIPFAEFAKDTIHNMLEKCPLDRYRQAREMLAGSVLPSSSGNTTTPAAPSSPTPENELVHQDEAKSKAKATPYGNDGAQDLDIELREEEEEDEGSSHLKGLPRPPFYQTDKGVHVRCRSRDVVHGYLASGEGLASLLVYEFYIFTGWKSTRIKAIDIQMIYHGRNGDPEMQGIAPERMLMFTTPSQTKSTTMGVNLSHEMDAKSGFKWERAISHDASGMTMIVPLIHLVGRTHGPPNAVSWKLRENQSNKSGVRGNIQVAVLLRRSNSDKFTFSLNIMAEVDTESASKRLLGPTRNTINDHIIYDPTMASTNSLHIYDPLNLGAIDLESLLAFRDYREQIDGMQGG